MGSITRQRLCNSFIEEFGQDYLRHHSVPGVPATKQHLGVDDLDECVRHFFEIDGEQRHLCLFYPVFHPSDLGDREEFVDHFTELLEIPRPEFVNRAVKADLIDD